MNIKQKTIIINKNREEYLLNDYKYINFFNIQSYSCMGTIF